MVLVARAVRLFAVAAVVLVSACDSAEERAEAHFQSGMTLLEEGDVDRALVEFRNVFKLDGYHREARRTYAEIERERGNIRSAYGHYLRLVEQYPDDFEARRDLLEMAIGLGDWQEMSRHLRLASDVPPEDPVIRLARLLLDYRQSVEERDLEAGAKAAEAALAMKPQLPDEPAIHEIRIDYFTRAGEYDAALDEIDAALELRPADLTLYQRRLALLESMGDVSGIEQQLQKMVEAFPDDPQIDATLLRWHLSRGNLDAAETFLRNRIAREDATRSDRVDLIRFMTQFRGRDAAIAELERMIDEGGDGLTFQSMRAALEFDAGNRAAAIEEMQGILETAQPSEETDNGKVALAQMLSATGNEVGARVLVEEVLGRDPTHVNALKMRADWLIGQDETDEAIITLRRALDESPRDPELLVLMARAHERAGSRELMGEMLSLAVEASNNAPEETLRYVRFLTDNERFGPAETSLLNALRVAPNDVELLQALGRLYLLQQDWARTEQVIATLRTIDAPSARSSVHGLSTQMMMAQGRTTETISLLEDLIAEGEGGIGARLAIIQAHLQEGRIAEAESFLDQELQDAPGDASLRFLSASLQEIKGETEAAEAIYRNIVAEQPGAVAAWRALYMLQAREGREDQASDTLTDALEANPGAMDLLWAKASELQRAGESEAAIAVYEAMYGTNAESPLVANNLASLLTTARSDDESLARAYAIARRLRNLEVPAFQDTYGWIAYRRGEYEEALAHLEPASAGLPDDALTQYHLAKAYEALGRNEDAIAQYRKAVEIAGQDSVLPQIQEAKDRIATLETASAEPD